MSFFAISLLCAVAPQGTTTFIPPGSTWKYLDDGSDQGTAWRQPAFDDSSWASGDAQLGYGDGDETTIVSFGPDPNDRYITTYFRHSFQVANPAASTHLNLRILRDDGAVAYLNGTEVVRSNMRTGGFHFLTTAPYPVFGQMEDLFYVYPIDPALLVAGTNVLAVEVHQQRPDSSDLSFDLQLDDAVPPLVERGPYLQLGTPSSVTVRWRTRDSNDSRVAYGPSPGNLNQMVDDPASVTDHEVRLTGLTPGTTYFYSIGTTTTTLAGGDADHFFRTAPAVGSTGPVRIWAIGDSGVATANARAVRDAYESFAGSTYTDVWLMLGDNAYLSGSDPEYQMAVFDTYPDLLRQSVVWSTRGNHEDSAAVYYDIFTLPAAGEAGGLASGTEAYYSFDHANIHFVCLDSDASDRQPGGAMLTWLENDLASTTQRWIIAFWHHPPYSKGSHDSDDPGDSGGRLRDMRQYALPVLEAGGVDLVLCGHSHSYERSFLIDGHYDVSATFDPATMLLDGGDGRETGDGAYQKHAGPRAGAVYCVAGCAGLTENGPLNHPVMFASMKELGSLVIDVSDDRLDLRFLDDQAVVRDLFTLLTDDPRPYLSVENLVAGQQATLSVIGATPGNTVIVGYSFTGGGPTPSQYGDIDLSPPILQIPPAVADPQGEVTIPVSVGANTSGRSVWLQSLELQGGGAGVLSNSLAEVIL